MENTGLSFKIMVGGGVTGIQEARLVVWQRLLKLGVEYM